MVAGARYRGDDPELIRDHHRAVGLTDRYNVTPVADQVGRSRILTELFGSLGAGTVVRAPLACDYGYQIHIGSNTFVNFGLVALDVARIDIGDDVQIGPNVQLLTAEHPLEAGPRRAKWESGSPIVIGDNVWLGGGVIVCPGITIGPDAVIGAGAVVTRDVPAGSLSAGVPARVVRYLPD